MVSADNYQYMLSHHTVVYILYNMSLLATNLKITFLPNDNMEIKV